jgi:NADPH:quinone reductase-like Zn-dependent oxidoreductase
MAGVPSVFLTAYYAMFELVHPHSWQTLLVHSAAGGVVRYLSWARVRRCVRVRVCVCVCV